MDRNTDIRVVLADDHQVVRVGIRKIISRTPDIRVIGEASNGVEAVGLTIQLRPDVLLLDIEMPGYSGLDVARKIKESGYKGKILILSGYDDSEYIQALLKEGISGYLVKGETPDRIITAIRAVAGGSGGIFSQKIVRQIPDLEGRQTTA
jgi:DNA-binding NarL/FixJ family response regulator